MTKLKSVGIKREAAVKKMDAKPAATGGGGFPIVGIGASAGGLAAFEAFFSGMPADREPGMAFVLVQHLAPDHKSILTELVKRYTKMQVFEVEDGMTVKPNCTYIIPPNKDMAFLNGTLQLLEPSLPRGHHLPIDFFFRSLAQDLHERAICIVLSGTGSDGTQGLRAIKGEGGMAMAQNPASTEYDGMPRSAIGTGLVDFVLPPAEMPLQLQAYSSHAFVKALHQTSESAPKTEDSMKKIFVLLRNQTDHDFSQYKQNTIGRRIERRMAVHQISNINSYVQYLQKNPDEIESLFRDLLIGVTRFFRDSAAFEALDKHAIPGIFDGKTPGSAIRVWVPGCATGEEAYSIAILVQEHLDKVKQAHKVQVFATDIDKKAIVTARTGLYPASISTDISPERLARFFTSESDGNAYRANKGIRDMLVFSVHDAIRDPPFSKLDMISCRNLMIYMDVELQKKLIPLFHYALKPDGFLLLGTSETVGEFTDLFSTLDRKSKLYQRKEYLQKAHRMAIGKFMPRQAIIEHTQPATAKASGDGKLQLREFTERALLQQYSPVGALVDERGDILFLYGRTGMYLEPTPGEARMNILKMGREGLRHELTSALRMAATRKEPVRRAGLKVKTNGSFTVVTPDVATESNLFLVIVEEATLDKAPAMATKGGSKKGGLATETQIAKMKQEMRAKDDYLQAITEEMETSNEELQSSNEEMQSVNEELQSTNEEMETSKEELQSTNEELATVNAELQNRVTDLSRATNDLNNLMAATGIGTIFVDHQLNIQRFTPSVTQVINLISTDVGRPVGHIVSNLKGYDRLVEDLKAVLDTLAPMEVEVQTKKGAWFLLRIRPYRTLENVIEGAVMTFTDITELKKAQVLLRDTEALRRLAAVVRDSRDPMVVQDLDGRIIAWNPAAEKMYGWREAAALSMNIKDLTPEAMREESLATVRSLALGHELKPYNTQRVAKGGKIISVMLTATALVDGSGKAYAIATTERKMDNQKTA
jgi:two-component system CheB/CheR fusion protein